MLRGGYRIFTKKNGEKTYFGDNGRFPTDTSVSTYENRTIFAKYYNKDNTYTYSYIEPYQLALPIDYSGENHPYAGQFLRAYGTPATYIGGGNINTYNALKNYYNHTTGLSPSAIIHLNDGTTINRTNFSFTEKEPRSGVIEGHNVFIISFNDWSVDASLDLKNKIEGISFSVPNTLNNTGESPLLLGAWVYIADNPVTFAEFGSNEQYTQFSTQTKNENETYIKLIGTVSNRKTFPTALNTMYNVSRFSIFIVWR